MFSGFPANITRSRQYGSAAFSSPAFRPFPQTNATCPVHDARDASRLPNVSEYGTNFPAFGSCSTYYFPDNSSADGIGAPAYSTVGHVRATASRILHITPCLLGS